jgi:hypothetical protein
VFFSPEDRERVQAALLERARADRRVVAGAVVGSEAGDGADRFSDIDLTFGVGDGVTVGEVLDDWTAAVRADLGGVVLFDLPVGRTVYRVFLLPGNLQVDLSFGPAAEFGATGPRFRLLFGRAVEKPWTGQPDARDLFGRAVHHALRARISTERGQHWQAEHWLAETRHHALALACLGRGLGAWHGRTVDRLPPDLLARYGETLPARAERDELLRALRAVVRLLEESADGVVEVPERTIDRLREVATP